MFVVKKNQVIITALVVMVAVAGYLNYIDSNPAAPSEVVLNDEGDISGLVPDDELFPVSAEEMAANDPEVNIASDYDDKDTEVVADNNAQTPSDNTEAEAADSDEPGAAVFVNTSSDSSYFVQAKLDREQSRSKQKEILTNMINNSNVDQTKKSECADAMLEIQQRIEKETAAEAMIEAKGFKEVYVRIDDDTVDVVVNKETLSEAEIAQIEDIVKRKTGVTADKIRISPIKK